MTVRYITVTPVTNMFKPATRSFGDIAIIGNTDADAQGPKKTPVPITNPDSVTYGSSSGNGLPVDDPGNPTSNISPPWFYGDLGTSVRIAFNQTPGPTKVWAVRMDSSDTDPLASALAEVAKLNVQIVTLANTPLNSASGSTEIAALAGHVNSVSNNGGDGKECIGVAMLGNNVTVGTANPVTSAMSIDRMVMVAHRSNEDAAAAAAGTIAGYEPHISLLLKQVSLEMNDLFSDSEIDDFNNARINWLTDPALLPGKGIFMGEGYTLGADMPYIDIVRTIDDISFRLKAMLIRSIGNLRVSRSGLRALSSQITAVLEPLQQRGVIEGYDVFFSLLVLLDKEPADLTDAELQQIANAQNSRVVDAIVSVDYAGAIHRLNITLKFE